MLLSRGGVFLKNRLQAWLLLFFFGFFCFSLGVYWREFLKDATLEAQAHTTTPYTKLKPKKAFEKKQLFLKSASNSRKSLFLKQASSSKPSKNVQKGYTLQVASYRDERDAVYHSLSLKSQGYTAFYRKASVKGQTWYRVFLGLFKKATTAKQFQHKLLTQNKIKEAIVFKFHD